MVGVRNVFVLVEWKEESRIRKREVLSDPGVYYTGNTNGQCIKLVSHLINIGK